MNGLEALKLAQESGISIKSPIWDCFYTIVQLENIAYEIPVEELIKDGWEIKKPLKERWLVNTGSRETLHETLEEAKSHQECYGGFNPKPIIHLVEKED